MIFDDKLYRFDIDSLLPGDVILTTNRRSLISAVIRKVTKSNFSHAAICSDPPILIEAIGPGVCRVSAARLAFMGLSNVAVYRIDKEHKAVYPATAAKAAIIASNKLLCGYYLKGAISTRIKAFNSEERNRFFCSHLIAASYKEAGLDLLPDKSPDFVTPGDLCHTPYLADVSQEVLVPIEFPELVDRVIVDRTDKKSEHSFHHEETTAKRNATIKFNKALFEAGLPKVDVFDNGLLALFNSPPDKASGLDEQFLDAIISEGIADIPNRFLSEFSPLIALTLQVELDRGSLSEGAVRELLAFYRERLPYSEKEAETRRYEYALFEKIVDKMPYHTFFLWLEKCRAWCDIADCYVQQIGESISILEAKLAEQPDEPYLK